MGVTPRWGNISLATPRSGGKTGSQAMPDVHCPQPHGPHQPPASPSWGPCSGHTKQGAQGTKGGGREPSVPPPPSAGAAGRGTKGPAIAGPPQLQPWQPSPRWPLATSHWPQATGQPWPLPPLWHPLLPAWPSSCPHAPFIHLSAHSPSVLRLAALGQGEDKEKEEEKGGCPSAEQRFCCPGPTTSTNLITNTNPLTSAGSLTSLSLIDKTSPITSPSPKTNHHPHSDAPTPQCPSRMGTP